MKRRWLILLMLLLAACAFDVPMGMQTLKNSGLSLYYPDTWVSAQTTENTVLLSNMSGDSQSLLLYDGLQTGQVAILIILSPADDLWKEGLSSAAMRRQIVTTSGWAARSGYSFGDPTEQTLAGHPVTIAPLTRRYPLENEPETFMLNEGLILGVDLGDNVTAQITCQTMTGEFEQFRAACIRVAESLHYEI